MFHTAFNDTFKPSYLYDNIFVEGNNTARREAIMTAVYTGVPVASARVVGSTAAGPRVGFTSDLFVPMYRGYNGNATALSKPMGLRW